MSGLVLSLFPGIGLLDMAFEAEGFCVVRGPDSMWGGDIRRFNPPAGKFAGVIGGPPCQAFSSLSNIVRAVHGAGSVAPNLIPEYERVVAAADPDWFVMENVQRAPLPSIAGYFVHAQVLNNRWCGGEQNRVRRISFGTRDGRPLHVQTEALEPAVYQHAVTTNSGGRRKVFILDKAGRARGEQGQSDYARLAWPALEVMARDQGLPDDFVARLKHGAFTSRAIRTGVGNGVPLPMGRAIAKAVKAAIQRAPTT